MPDSDDIAIERTRGNSWSMCTWTETIPRELKESVYIQSFIYLLGRLLHDTL